MQRDSQDKDMQLLEKRFVELSRLAYQRDIITYTDFLNLNEQNILHTLPKDRLYAKYVSFGGYAMAERQMAAFIPDALYLRCGKTELSFAEAGFPFSAVKITPLNRRFAEELSHRDYLGSVLSLGIERSKTGDILTGDSEAVIFVHSDLEQFLKDELTRVRHTPVTLETMDLENFSYVPRFEEITGTVASVRLDSLLALAFSSSRSRLSGLIEGAKVFVNGKLVTSNGYQPKEGDIISVRGMGKFCFAGVQGQTRKKRTAVTVHRYS